MRAASDPKTFETLEAIEDLLDENKIFIAERRATQFFYNAKIRKVRDIISPSQASGKRIAAHLLLHFLHDEVTTASLQESAYKEQQLQLEERMRSIRGSS